MEAWQAAHPILADWWREWDKRVAYATGAKAWHLGSGHPIPTLPEPPLKKPPEKASL
jgi:hypothetical protein